MAVKRLNPASVEVSAPTPPVARAWLIAVGVFSLTFLLVGLLYAQTAAAGLSWRSGGEDGGDLATALALGGVPHPTGYPLYLLAGRFLLGLSDDPARVLNLASALWGAIAAGLFGSLTYRLSRLLLPAWLPPDSPKLPPSYIPVLAAIAGLATGLGLAVAPLVWSQAVIAEVYSFNLMLMGATLLALVGLWQAPASRRGGRLALLGAVGGLAVGHHRTALFTLMAGGVLILVVWRQERVRPFRLLHLPLAMLLMGLGIFLPYLYLVLRGGATPASNWSDVGPTNLAGLQRHFLGSDYGYLVLAAPLGQSLARLAAAVGMLVGQFGPVGLGLGWLGLVVLGLNRAGRPWLALSLSGLGLHTFWAAIYAAENSEIYLLPVFGLWAVLIGLGLGWLSLLLLSGLPGFFQAGLFQKNSPLVTLVLTLVVGLGLPLLGLLSHYAELDASRDRGAETWARATLDAAPPAALVLSSSDATSFALWYVHYARGSRPDLAVVETRLLGQEWYRRNLHRLYPDLQFDPTRTLSADELQKANPTRPALLIPNPRRVARRQL